MRFGMCPAHMLGHEGVDRYGGPLWALVIEAPDRPEEDEGSVEDFFWRIKSSLDDLYEEIVCVLIILRSSEGIGPASSSFLPALCSLLREHPFRVAEDRTHHFPQRLVVKVGYSDEEEQEADQEGATALMDRSDPIVQEATNQICLSFWENRYFRGAEFVCVDVPVVPATHVLDRFYDERPGMGGVSDPYTEEVCPAVSVTMNVRQPTTTASRSSSSSSVPDMLCLERGEFRIFAEGPVHGTNAVRQMLLSSSTSSFRWYSEASSSLISEPWLRVHMYTSQAAKTFVQCLTELPNHKFQRMTLCAGNPKDLGFASTSDPLQLPSPHLAVDVGADLCRAALRCSSVTCLVFVRIGFASSALEAAHEAFAMARPSSSAIEVMTGATAKLKELSFHSCNFPDPAVGPVQVAIAMSRTSNKLDFLGIRGYLDGGDMTSICSGLTDSEWELTALEIASACDEDGRAIVVKDDPVMHFFQRLPFMKTFQILSFYVSVPESLSRIVVDGFKNNYWLRRLNGQLFYAYSKPSSELQDAIEAYVAANRKGRATMYEAVSNPDDLDLQEEAIQVLHRLSNSDDDLDDATSLFLCLQLFLPSLTRRSAPSGRTVP